jgi:hypothetical protein
MTVNDLMLSLDDYGYEDTDTLRKVEKIQAAIWAIERREAWPFLQASADLTFAGGTQLPVTQPTRFRAGVRAKDLTTGTRLEAVRFEDAEDFIGVNYASDSDPRIYYFEGGQLKVWPQPPAGRVVRFKYIQRSAPITADSTDSDILIPAEHYEAILLGALMRLSVMEDDEEIAAAIEPLFEQAVAEMISDVMPEQFDRTDYIHVFDPDDWDLYS